MAATTPSMLLVAVAAAAGAVVVLVVVGQALVVVVVLRRMARRLDDPRPDVTRVRQDHFGLVRRVNVLVEQTDVQQRQLAVLSSNVESLSSTTRFVLAETIAHDEDLRQVVELLGGKPRPRQDATHPALPSIHLPLPGDGR